jgi:hypothetical protein
MTEKQPTHTQPTDELTFLYALMDDRLEYKTPGDKYSSVAAEELQKRIDDASSKITPLPNFVAEMKFNKLAYSRLLKDRANHQTCDFSCIDCRRFHYLNANFILYKQQQHNNRLRDEIVHMRSELVLRRVKELEALNATAGSVVSP